MCGIICTLNSAYHSADLSKFIADGILAGAVRGQDSTGIMQVDKKGSIYTHKQAASGVKFLNDNVTTIYVKDANSSPINVVHHRAATVGVINAGNAHPFICQMPSLNASTGKHNVLVGVHNGSLTNWRGKVGAKDYEVDSEWALSRIATQGIEAFKEIEGPYCFMWTTTESPGKLFVARNSGRPMHMALSKDGKQAYFASEAGMLSWLCERNRITVEDTILVVGTDKVYTFDTTGNEIAITAVDIPKKPVPVTTSNVTHHQFVTRNNGGKNTTLNEAGQDFIDKIKRAADGKLVFSTPTTAQVEEAVNKNVETPADEKPPFNQDDEGYFVPDQVPTDWYSVRNSTVSERELAKKWGMYGELQWFSGVVYDNSTAEIIGDIDVWDRDAGKVKYAGVIRGCSEARANSEYIDNDLGKKSSVPGNWVVVVGAREETALGRILVVAELTQAGRAGLEKMAVT